MVMFYPLLVKKAKKYVGGTRYTSELKFTSENCQSPKKKKMLNL